MAPPGLAPIVHMSVNEAVYRKLRDHLMQGDYAAGAVLGIQELADALGTSMMPVREALRRLAAQQALEPTRSRSMRVPPMSLERLDDIRRTRQLVECAALELAAPRLGAAELRALRQLAAKIGEALASPRRLDAGLALNQQFHFSIYRASGSASMLAIIESLWLQSGPYLRAARELMHSAARPADELHASLVDALEALDLASARKLLVRDIAWAFDRVQAAHPLPRRA